MSSGLPYSERGFIWSYFPSHVQVRLGSGIQYHNYIHPLMGLHWPDHYCFFFWFFPFFFFGISSSWDFMVLTSCVSQSNLTVLSCLMFLPDWASLYLHGCCAKRLSGYSLSTFHSSKEWPVPCNRHVLFSLAGTSLGWPTWFLLGLPERPFSVLDGEADSPPCCFLPRMSRFHYYCWLFWEGDPPS